MFITYPMVCSAGYSSHPWQLMSPPYMYRIRLMKMN